MEWCEVILHKQGHSACLPQFYVGISVWLKLCQDVFMEVFKGVQEEGSQSSESSCMVIFRAEPVDAVRPGIPPGVPGVSHGSCTPRASFGTALMTPQGLWPFSERGLKSVCPPAPSPSDRRAPMLALIPGCAGGTCPLCPQ